VADFQTAVERLDARFCKMEEELRKQRADYNDCLMSS